MASQQQVIAGKYAVGDKLGSGSFGDIYLGTILGTGAPVAIKVESVKAPHPLLVFEAKLYQLVSDGVHIPKVHWYGVEGEFTVMVLDLLGPSLEDLLEFCNQKLSKRTVASLGVQMIDGIEYVHSRSFLHRDIKPENFLMGVGKTAGNMYVIDFGLAKRYRNARTKEHIPFRNDRNLTGTARYASVGTHRGLEQSRRDDIEAIGYVLMYLVRGNLPWQERYQTGPKAKTNNDKYKRIQERKEAITLEVLGKNAPPEFIAYMTYGKNLGFTDRPDYAWCRFQMQAAMMRESKQPFNRSKDWDWDIKYQLDKEEQAAKFGETAVEKNLSLSDKLRRDAWNKRRTAAPNFHKADANDANKGDARSVHEIGSAGAAEVGNGSVAHDFSEGPTEDGIAILPKKPDQKKAELETPPPNDAPVVVDTSKAWATGSLTRNPGEKSEMVVFSCPLGEAFSIGRGSKCSLSLEGVPLVSTNHCSLQLESEVATGSLPKVILTDGSLNGTFVDGDLLGKGNQATIANGSLITFAKGRDYPQIVMRLHKRSSQR